MEINKAELEQFYKLKEIAKTTYERIGSIYCPALKDDIVFNSDGFHHLRYDCHRSERSKQVQKNKFIYFDKAVEILKKTTTIQEYRRSICAVGDCDKNGFHKTKIIEWFGFFAIISFVKCIRINVVVRRIGEGSGKFHFWSVMPFWTLSSNKRVIGSKKIEDE
ncbi:hypothetical protein A2316_01000 [Candidatus Falkowbacteria bacterium RIFOXYB2_FULL_38_15]|uniref:Uncharacterized protein n=1 Tax=Candidatus Falkowbacteria bacterium RIFOXYA2_FULL_38_12 TaxID=1797993 RepID=A0A1F5S4J8_9BACT|nr:MAG: hypothetical protein A2257_02405 [Candidatus Falkowbacteria bacterium RIFOXYA2_FULL_38_12]OGF32768.1 MAG: hypothetical protein A2316_01000 [Candidatus Falkowbacteria bacterium RIFOXYB2_FULL_38_15]OGF42196.1 MAG: hypothetical protein A2555_02895 [Candidatus Falkowbacteria bacterium RIFOXYD2_FULL_39_16]